jgi:hypothetical protein
MRNETWLRMLSGFVLVGVFAAGALFGAGLLRWTQNPPERLPPPPHHGGPGGPGGPGGRSEKMRHELALDESQMRALDDIMQKHRVELETIMRSTQSRVRVILFAIEDELRPHLRPDQVKRLEDWRATRPPPPMPGLDGPPPHGPPPHGPPPGGPR